MLQPNSGAVSSRDYGCFNLKFRCCAHEQSKERSQSLQSELIPVLLNTCARSDFPSTWTLAVSNILKQFCWGVVITRFSLETLVQLIFFSTFNHQITTSVITKQIPHTSPQPRMHEFYEERAEGTVAIRNAPATGKVSLSCSCTVQRGLTTAVKCEPSRGSSLWLAATVWSF